MLKNQQLPVHQDQDVVNTFDKTVIFKTLIIYILR